MRSDPDVVMFGEDVAVAEGPFKTSAGLLKAFGPVRVRDTPISDGAANIGAFHEGLNLAAIWELRVVFICENNLYGEYSRINLTTSVADVAVRADSYGMPGVIVDGQDVDAVEAAVRAALDRARSGNGPSLLECKTYRYAGHSRGDAATYRPAGELDAWRARDPMEILSRRLMDEGVLTEERKEAILRDAAATIERAIEAVIAAPRPGVADMFRHVLAPPKRMP